MCNPSRATEVWNGSPSIAWTGRAGVVSLHLSNIFLHVRYLLCYYMSLLLSSTSLFYVKDLLSLQLSNISFFSMSLLVSALFSNKFLMYVLRLPCLFISLTFPCQISAVFFHLSYNSLLYVKYLRSLFNLATFPC